jgi:nucleoside-diphosphate-sugar epimerase
VSGQFLYRQQTEHILHLMENPNFELIRHDLAFPVFLEVDEIYNLACPASPIHYQHNPVKTVKTNVLGSIHMLGLAKRVHAKFCRPPPAKSTETPRFTRRRKATGAM